MRFVVIGSDVVYPNGSMIDYETNFWLPFKGVTKPVYAIPGNHDWYDALEAFNATFLEPDAARAAMRARAEADLRVSSTTDARIESLLAEAARLRGEYGVPTGFQRGPFFEIQSDRFALRRDRHRHREADRRRRNGSGSSRRSNARAASSSWPSSGTRSTRRPTTWRMGTSRSRGSSACSSIMA